MKKTHQSFFEFAEVCLVTNIPELLRWPTSEWMTAISAWPSMAGKMSKIYQGYMGALAWNGAIWDLLTRWLTLELSQSTGDLIYNKRGHLRMAGWSTSATDWLLIFSWWKLDDSGRFLTWWNDGCNVKLPWNGSAFRNQKEGSECSNKTGYEWMSCWLVLRINGWV